MKEHPMKLTRAPLSRGPLTAAIASALLGLTLVGCGTAPESGAMLDEARSAVAEAEADPNVTRYAPTELDRARKLLMNAESSAKEKGAKDPTAAHYAYLTTQLARIAEQRANEQAAMARIKAGETERQKILLSAREAEASNALAMARSATDQARSAQADAQAAQANAQAAQAQVAQSEAERQRLAAQLEEMQAKQTSRGIVLTLDDVLFDTGRAELKPGANRSIEQIASFLGENPERRVQIEGFTDSQGTDDYNLELSQSRADAVAMAIIQRGVAAERVRALGFGEQFPVASNTNAGSRQLNRRVEIIVSNENATIPGRTSGSP
jgi:outer membrane protein OmpA-like peptidoglycan-associated protein